MFISKDNNLKDLGETIISVNDIVKYSLENKCDVNTIFINPKIKYIPTLSVQELVETSVENNRRKNANKTCNAFFIFRTEFSNEAKKLGFNSGQISVHASICWKRFPDHIKDIYRNLSKEVNVAFKQRVPVGFIDVQKTKKRRRNRDIVSRELTSSHNLIDGNNQQEHSMNLIDSMDSMDSVDSTNSKLTNLHLASNDSYYQELKLTCEAIINSIPNFHNVQQSNNAIIDSIFSSITDFDNMQLSTDITSKSNQFDHSEIEEFVRLGMRVQSRWEEDLGSITQIVREVLEDEIVKESTNLKTVVREGGFDFGGFKKEEYESAEIGT
ncbi:10336_t:CDS:2 [Scutellospora calospora]|uniref:10336_t:CDS:1 n=1 Tax=Scutellospora calospora TaxID=85575 RepID=A0ACA9KKI9_9GLOM|nr:10336_t:CDS:2 [Scutellospora calospora]